ncbi:M24 family metallopeptidase [Bowmanella pacifica]|uniref:Metallopeptidase n=1 Tax=Bowmanella pacifica TaxID=502051 RepID=A0A917YYI5_9ALTE|nr:Xaa-Pro peptidase family protein [Bowmanella pacifica]GGO68041.1 metallopeptidase [Bowmanella pacifica]
MQLSKRRFLQLSAGVLGSLPFASMAAPKTSSQAKDVLSDITQGVQPISAKERMVRIDKARTLMRANNMVAMVLEPGPAMDYFTGIQWWRSERLTAVVIPADGEIAVICPFFEEPSIRESLDVGNDVRVWQEHESPFALVAQVLKDRKLSKGQIGFEESVRYFVLDGVMSLLGNFTHTSADPVTRGCRMYKTAHELTLMHKANEITLSAYAYVWKNLQTGMTQADVKALMQGAQTKLGGSGIWNMALFDQASAYPHGTKQQHVLKEGSVVLMDCGCAVHGYQSDISRTFVYGEPSAKVRKIWNTVREGQNVAFAAAQPGKAAGSVDDAVRAYYAKQGLGPDYKLPGLSHRTGHGIGMQGHEPVNFVRGETALLKSGMCFSNEPGIYLPGEFGVRLEDCIYMTENGPRWFTEPADSLESPIGKLAPPVA